MSKYPRTYHLGSSEGLQNDDRHQKDITNLIGVPVVITEKLDGENTGITQGGVYARSHATYTTNAWAQWVRQLQSRIGYQIPEDLFLFGENMEGIHSIEYSNLKSFFYLFGVKENETFLEWREVEDYAYLLDLELVPILFKGTFNSEEELNNKVDELTQGRSQLGGNLEGIVCRVQSAFLSSKFQDNCIKWVRKGHVQTDSHWTKNWKKATINY
tara:strand:- start:70312 stop:70953 length:642 start_codon:yes stop_codon:yes gene_type:complete